METIFSQGTWLELAAMVTVLAATAMIQYTGSSFFHELGHISTARKFIPDMEAEIEINYLTIPYVKPKNCRIIRKKESLASSTAATCYMDYPRFTPEQIADIATGGIGGAAVFHAIACIMTVVLLSLISVCSNSSLTAYLAGFLTVISVFVSLTFMLMQVINYHFFGKNSDMWSDKRIADDPEGFLCYIKNILSQCKSA